MTRARRERGVSRSDVARLAGVSPPTVSLALNGKAEQVRLSQATRERVLAAAHTLRYVPNAAARAMRGRRHLTLGIIARPPGSPATLHVSAFEDFAVGAIEQAAEHAHNVKFLAPAAAEDTYDVVATLRDAQVDGILVHNLSGIVRDLVHWRVPVVSVGLGEDPVDLPLDRAGAVIADEEGGLRAAARHVIELGHTRVGVIAGPNHRPGPLGRIRAFVDELDRFGAGVAVTQLGAADWSPESGYHAMREMLAHQPEITAVHAGNDWMAAGVIRALHEAKRKIPGDVAVLGFGDFRVSGYLEPPLTTVRWPLAELGRRAVDMLIAQLGTTTTDSADGVGRNVLATELVVRSSTARRTGSAAT